MRVVTDHVSAWEAGRGRFRLQSSRAAPAGRLCHSSRRGPGHHASRGHGSQGRAYTNQLAVSPMHFAAPLDPAARRASPGRRSPSLQPTARRPGVGKNWPSNRAQVISTRASVQKYRKPNFFGNYGLSARCLDGMPSHQFGVLGRRTTAAVCNLGPGELGPLF